MGDDAQLLLQRGDHVRLPPAHRVAADAHRPAHHHLATRHRVDVRQRPHHRDGRPRTTPTAHHHTGPRGPDPRQPRRHDLDLGRRHHHHHLRPRQPLPQPDPHPHLSLLRRRRRHHPDVHLVRRIQPRRRHHLAPRPRHRPHRLHPHPAHRLQPPHPHRRPRHQRQLPLVSVGPRAWIKVLSTFLSRFG